MRGADFYGSLVLYGVVVPFTPAASISAASAVSSIRTATANEIQELRRSKNSFNALADNEEWLADNFKKIIHSHDPPVTTPNKMHIHSGRVRTRRHLRPLIDYLVD
jgi:hypothetical protein